MDLLLKDKYSISEASVMLDISKSTIRNWEKKGDIPKIRKSEYNGYRELSPKDILLIAKIKHINRILV